MLLGAGMYQSDTSDTAMAEDALRELANMTAGKVRRALRLDEALAVPRMVAPGVINTVSHKSVVLSNGNLRIAVWLADSTFE